ncbi:hypothetical protein NQ318_006460 [Aromia moschata]|uniref:THAP-type domain-containing protein n=1 Tax=Aromia moschata TaxID=1265417 RepID=A0AAV8XA54_9CUCU|nr:hypothetical protein NQ318_006460 [Aromia moschata]
MDNVVRRRRCAVPGCEDRVSVRHRFPINDEKTFNSWVLIVDHPHFSHLTPREIYNSYLVCHRHFSEDSIVVGTKRGLKVGAIPTLFLPTKPVKTKPETEPRNQPNEDNRDGEAEEEKPNIAALVSHIILDHNYCLP